MLVPTATCFCDIPFEHLDLHLSKYGLFGLSLNKHLLIKYGARPVIYVPLRSDDWGPFNGCTWLNDLEAVYKGFRAQIYDRAAEPQKSRSLGHTPSSPESAAHALDSALTLYFLAFIKPYNSLLSEDHPNYFYAEREWRKFGNQRFEPDDVREVVVADGYAERIKEELPFYADKVVLAPKRGL